MSNNILSRIMEVHGNMMLVSQGLGSEKARPRM
jgi:hypothetical protein